jgi:hypothetical protein
LRKVIELGPQKISTPADLAEEIKFFISHLTDARESRVPLESGSSKKREGEALEHILKLARDCGITVPPPSPEATVITRLEDLWHVCCTYPSARSQEAATLPALELTFPPVATAEEIRRAEAMSAQIDAAYANPPDLTESGEIAVPAVTDDGQPIIATGRTQDSAAKHNESATIARDPATEARDKWIYEQAMKGRAWASIMRSLDDKPKTWERLSTENGVKDAAKRYAKRHSLPMPQPRKAGRRNTK